MKMLNIPKCEKKKRIKTKETVTQYRIRNPKSVSETTY